MESTVSSSLRVWESGGVWSRTEPEADWGTGPTLNQHVKTHRSSIQALYVSLRFWGRIAAPAGLVSMWKEAPMGSLLPYTAQAMVHMGPAI